MKFEFSGVKLNVEFDQNKIDVKNKIFFLHGFTGSADDWNILRPKLNNNFFTAAIDLIGHGKSDSPKDPSFYTADSIVEQLYFLIKKFTDKKIFLIGYSMGGRAALSFAVKYPRLLNGLILESSTAGIIDELLREERVKSDDKLAQFILENPIEEFVDYWMNQDIFNTQKRFSNEKLNSIREQKIKNNPVGLANSLRGFSTGKMPPLFDKVKKIKAETLLISGELDEKYTEINEQLLEKLSFARHAIIKNAGHNTHLEESDKFLEVVSEYLGSFEK